MVGTIPNDQVLQNLIPQYGWEIAFGTFAKSSFVQKAACAA